MKQNNRNTIHGSLIRGIDHSLSFKEIFSAALLAIVLGLGMSPAYAQDAAPEAVATTVNINTADAQLLAAALNGVGHSRAEEIVRYREEFGPFASVDELKEVKGIGKSTLEKNRALITLE